MNDSDKQTKLCLYVMNHHKFLMICMLKYHQKFWCLVIYKPFYRSIVYCNTRQYTFKHYLSPIATSKKNCHEFVIM